MKTLSSIVPSKISYFVLLFFVLSSCSNEADQEISNFEKSGSIEIDNVNYFRNSDGSISKFVNQSKSYDIILNTEIELISNFSSRSDNDESIIRLHNPTTDEYIDLSNFVEYDDYFTFDALLSNGQTVNEIISYDEDLLDSLTTNVSEVSRACPWCYVVAVVVAAIVEISEDSPLEQCQSAMASLDCVGGTNPFMEYSEGWFSTECNVGCR